MFVGFVALDFIVLPSAVFTVLPGLALLVPAFALVFGAVDLDDLDDELLLLEALDDRLDELDRAPDELARPLLTLAPLESIWIMISSRFSPE